MTPYEVPPSSASYEQNRFSFVVDGKTYDVPKMDYLSLATVEAIADAETKGEVAMAGATLQLFGSADSPAGRAIRTLDSKQLEGLVEAWAAASGTDLGESQGSTGS